MLQEPDLPITPRALDWECETVERGASVTGIVVGRLHKYRCHVFGKITKPCLDFATKGKLACVCQIRPMEVRDVGYLPIITGDKSRLVIVLSSLACAQAAEGCRQGVAYKFSRPKKVKSRIRIGLPTPADMGSALPNMRPTKNQDILEYLCHVWQLHDLTRFCGFSPRQPLKVAAKNEVTEAPYEPRFARGKLRVLGDALPPEEAA